MIVMIVEFVFSILTDIRIKSRYQLYYRGEQSKWNFRPGKKAGSNIAEYKMK